MSEQDINRWQNTITPRDKAPLPWTVKSGGSFDMLDVQPIPDEMLSELAQMYSYCGTPWNCHSLPLSPTDREYMYLLYFSMQGLVARMRKSEQRAEAAEAIIKASREQGTVDCVKLTDCVNLHDREFGNGYFATGDCVVAMYPKPPIPPDVAELQRQLEDARKVPEGWQLVPVSPTDKMCEAAHFGPNCAEHDLRASDRAFWEDCYRAMLSAAPTTDQPKE